MENRGIRFAFSTTILLLWFSACQVGPVVELSNQEPGTNALENQGVLEEAAAGGVCNEASGFRTVIGGGCFNQALTAYATIGGGAHNVADGYRAVIGGGVENEARGFDATVSGGSGNQALGQGATIGGGSANQAGHFNTIGGGLGNHAQLGYATIGGGVYNRAIGTSSFIGGGAGNLVEGANAAICGGLDNIVADRYSFVGGGSSNQAGSKDGVEENAPYATVGGGVGNIASGMAATVPGGEANLAGAAFSFAAGSGAVVDHAHAGTFVYADASGLPFYSRAENEFAVRAAGGVRFVTSIDSQGEPMVGVVLAPGSGAWSSLSSREAKEDILHVDAAEVLAALRDLPISTWRYAGQDAGVVHMGPMARDFHAAFGLGEDERYISAVDVDGVTLAALQGLADIVEAQGDEIERLEQENLHLEERLIALEGAADPDSVESRMGAAHSLGDWFPIAITAAMAIFVAWRVPKRQW